MTPETNTENTQTTTEVGGADVLQEAVAIASDLLVINRDQKNAAIVIAGMTSEEKAGLRSFVTRVHAQANANKNVYKLIQEQAKARNAGRPARTRKPKAETAGSTAKK